MDQYQCFECGMVSEELVQMKSNMDTAHAIKVDSEMIVRKFPCSQLYYNKYGRIQKSFDHYTQQRKTQLDGGRDNSKFSL